MEKWRALLVVALVGFLAVWLVQAWPSLKARFDARPGAEAAARLAASARWDAVRDRTAARPLAARRVAPATLRQVQADWDWLQGVRMAEQLDALHARAHADPAFAYSLAFALYQCRFAEPAYRRNEVTFIVRSDKMIAVRDREKLDRTFAKCEGLADEQRRAPLELLTRAAQAGVFEAQRDYARLAGDALAMGDGDPTGEQIDDYRRNAVAYTESAARTGDPDAIYYAYAMYHHGRPYAAADPVRAAYWAGEYARVSPGPLADKLLQEARRALTPSGAAASQGAASRP
jgi:hypothetical protein